MVQRGVLVRRQSVIPYGRMQFIDVTAGPLERSLGLATVRMHTAAAASDARIPAWRRAGGPCGTSWPRSARRWRRACDQHVAGRAAAGRVAGDIGKDLAGWHRLHPLSPFVRAGSRLMSLVIVLVGIAVLNQHQSGQRPGPPTWSSSGWRWPADSSAGW